MRLARETAFRDSLTGVASVLSVEAEIVNTNTIIIDRNYSSIKMAHYK